MSEKTITLAMVQERLGLLQKEFQQLLDLQKVYEGGIQDCKHWISVLEDKSDG
jgi:hypothetical protein